MDVSISIVNFDTKDMIISCLDSIFKHTQNITFEVIVVDNGSKDGSPDLIKAKFPQVKLILNEKNEGFASAHNKAYKISKSEYFVVLNSDVVINSNIFYELKCFMDSNTDVGLVVPKVLYPDGRIQDIHRFFPGIRETLLGALFTFKILDREKYFKYSVRNWNYDEVALLENEYPMGCCYFIRRSAVQGDELFDSNFSLVYSEDADLCYRLRTSNFKIVYYPKVSVVHYSGYTTKHKKAEDSRLFLKIRVSFWKNKFYFVRKHRGVIYEIVLRFIVALSFLILVPLTFLKKDKVNRKIYLAILLYTLFSKEAE